MKRKVLFLLTAALLASAVWYIHRGDGQGDPAAFAGGRSYYKGEDEAPEKYHETIRKGLGYLVAQQHADGHWEGDDGRHPVAMTGLAGLALIMHWAPPGRGFREVIETNGKNAKILDKAVEWLISKNQAGRDGLFYSDHPSDTSSYMEGHALATIFLACVYRTECGQPRGKKIADVLTPAVKYIAKAQSSQGGWYHTSRVEGHDFDSIAATALQLQALHAVHHVGLPVPQEVMRDAQAYLKTAISKQGRASKEDIASALACCEDFSDTGDMDKMALEWFKKYQSEIPVGRDIQFGRDERLHYYYAQAVFNKGSKEWQNYRSVMFDHLQSTQAKDGSWPPDAGIGVGPVYSTATWCVVLQLGRNRHPSMPMIHEIVK